MKTIFSSGTSSVGRYLLNSRKGRIGGRQASAILHVGTAMGMWVLAGELKDVPEPDYTPENEARPIKRSRRWMIIFWRRKRY